MLQDEKLLTMSEAAASLPRPKSSCTIWRWARYGVRGRKLEALILGGQLLTSIEAIERFSRALAEQPLHRLVPKIEAPRLRKRKGIIVAARKNLAKSGV